MPARPASLRAPAMRSPFHAQIGRKS